METILKSLSDPYARKARLYPAFLTLLPIILGIAIYTDWFDFDLENALFIALGTAALFWLASLSRQLGKAKEEALLQKWKHLPSVTMLRHRNTVIDQYTTERYHRAAERMIPGIRMPTAQEEEMNKADSDDRYRSVVKYLLSNTRDTKIYNLLFKELINYGFQRNMLGLKSIALTIALSVIAFAAWNDWSLISMFKLPDGSELALMLVGVSASAAWIVNVTENSVRQLAEAYAARLLEALEAF